MSAFFELRRELNNRISIFRTSNNFTEPHFHSNIELVYVVDGHFAANINGCARVLSSGGISIANSFDIHSYQSPENSDAIILIIPVEAVSSYGAMLRSRAFSSPFIDACGNTGKVYQAMTDLLSSGQQNELINKGIAYYILGILSGCVELVDKPVAGNTDLARKILVYLQQNYLDELTIESLSRQLGYNKDYLSRFFNSYLGIGFNSYINALRSRHAAQLMSNGQTDLTEVSFSSGFSSYRTFNRSFQQSFGITPSDYKKKIACG